MSTICTVDGCDRDTNKGDAELCTMHYSRRYAGRPLGPAGYLRVPNRTLEERLRDRTARLDSGCWQWTGGKTNGYGAIWQTGRVRYAHRVWFEVTYGPIPAGMVIDHLCTNRWCVNPDHLEVVTNEENSRRGGRTTGARGRGEMAVVAA